ncbi:MAG: Nif3-like dinuclear metal center hexameric protein [Deltaproteobacteria bacterium]|nr:Nif3-like dinuclear metal center hexameric protein [Deltaproteobacteria bacterium]
MIKRDEICAFLDSYLNIDGISDKSSNGLQVEGTDNIQKIALATDASLSTYKSAIEQNCQMILTHHGLIWGGLKYITGRNYSHLKYLIENSLNLYAAHLPLDLHPEVGNNAALARLLKMKHIRPFGDYYGINIGYMGIVDPPMTISEVENVFSKELDCKPNTLKFGTDPISKIAIISGGGSSLLEEAIEVNAHCLITGEGTHDRYIQAKESNINLMYLGHYKSETIGVKELGKRLKEEFDTLDTVFIDAPTGF